MVHPLKTYKAPAHRDYAYDFAIRQLDLDFRRLKNPKGVPKGISE
jgi:hypothetical protein